MENEDTMEEESKDFIKSESGEDWSWWNLSSNPINVINFFWE